MATRGGKGQFTDNMRPREIRQLEQLCSKYTHSICLPLHPQMGNGDQGQAQRMVTLSPAGTLEDHLHFHSDVSLSRNSLERARLVGGPIRSQIPVS